MCKIQNIFSFFMCKQGTLLLPSSLAILQIEEFFFFFIENLFKKNIIQNEIWIKTDLTCLSINKETLQTSETLELNSNGPVHYTKRVIFRMSVKIKVMVDVINRNFLIRDRIISVSVRQKYLLVRQNQKCNIQNLYFFWLVHNQNFFS